MADLLQISLINGIPSSGTGTVATINALMADGGQATLGHTTDTANPATNATPATGIGIWKQISKSIQDLVSKWPTALGAGGGLKVDGSGTALPVSIASVPSHAVTNSGTFAVQQASGKSSKVTFTCGTTAYAAGDVVGAGGGAAALTFANIAAAAGEIEIQSIALMIETAAIISGETSYTLHLYNVTPPSALADSAAWDLPSGDRSAYLGSIAMSNIVDLGSTLYIESSNVGKRVKTAGTSLFGYLVSNGAYTPTARAFDVTISSRTV